MSSGEADRITWCPRHQRLMCPVDHRPSAARRGYDSRWQRVRAAYLRNHPDCVACGASATDVDHILPLRSGGSHDLDNLRSLCHRCHSRRTARDSSGWSHR